MKRAIRALPLIAVLGVVTMMSADTYFATCTGSEPRFAPGYYTLSETAVEKNHTLTYKRPVLKKDDCK
jgi:hypothetical protein